MNRFKPLSLALLLALTPFATRAAPTTEAPVSVTADMRASVVAALATQLDAKYVFPEIAKRVDEYLTRHEVGWLVSHEGTPDGETCLVSIPLWNGGILRVAAVPRSRALHTFEAGCFAVFRRGDVL